MNKQNEIQLKQEKLLGCGTFVWNSAKPQEVKWSVGMFALVEMREQDINLSIIKSIIVDEDLQEIEENFTYNIKACKENFDVLIRIKCGKNQIKKLNCRLDCSYDNEGVITEAIGVCIDMSFDNQRDYSTRLNDEKFYRLFGDAPIGISLLRTDGTCFLSNESFTKNVKYSDYELKDLPFQALIEEEQQHAFVNLYSNVIKSKIPSFRKDFRIVDKNGEKIWYEITVSSVKDINDCIKYIIVMTQPSQRNAANVSKKGLVSTIREELIDLSLRDSLSGLYNRQYVLKRLKELILIYYEKHLSFSALLVDVDYINKINVKYGYDCGDKVIHVLSEIFKTLTRDTDVCARWGGEEFIIVFPELDIDTALKLGERLRTEVKNTIIVWEGKEIQMTVSVNVTAYTSEDTLKTFLAKVDHVLYEDKKENRDSVRII